MRDWKFAPKPEGWKSVPFLQFVTLPIGQVDPRIEPYSSMILVAPDHIESGSGHLLSRVTAEAQGAISGKYIFAQGDTLYSKIRPYLRKAFFADCDGITSADMYPLRPTELVIPRFLTLLVLGEHFSRFADIVSMRSGFPKINREELAEYTAALPPTEEQHRIGEILGSIDETIQRTEQIIAKLQLIKQGILHDLMTRGIDENGELRDPTRHPILFNSHPLPTPRAWKTMRVGDVGKVQLGRARSPHTDNGPNMVPYLRVANVLDGVIDYSEINRMHFSATEQERYTVRPGDILLNEGQSTELVGRCAIYDGPESVYCYQNSLVNFRCGPLVIPTFARALFKWWLDRGRFTLILKQTTSMAHLGAQRFANLTLQLPSIEEQRQMKKILNSQEDRLRQTELSITKLRLLKSALMDDLLTGRVRTTSLLEHTP